MILVTINDKEGVKSEGRIISNGDISFQGNFILSALHNEDSENDNTNAQRPTGGGEITRTISSFEDCIQLSRCFISIISHHCNIQLAKHKLNYCPNTVWYQTSTRAIHEKMLTLKAS